MAGCVRLTTLPPSCAVVMKSGNLDFLEPSGPLQACNGTAAAAAALLENQMCNLQSLYNACKTGSLSKRNDTESVNVSFMAPLHLNNMIDFYDYSATFTNRCIQ